MSANPSQTTEPQAVPEETLGGMIYLPPPPARGFDDVGDGWNVETDVVVVGTGPGGAAAGHALAEAGHRVVFLEEGPPQNRFASHYADAMRFHMQEAGGMVATGSALVGVAAGRGVGGGTLVNSAICWRAPDAILDTWGEQLDAEHLNAKSIGKRYTELETLLGVAETPDGIAGENNRLIVRGVKALGYEGGFMRRNTPGCIGAGVCYFGCPVLGKNGVNHNLLPRAVGAGARIQADTKVVDVIVENNRAVGVRGYTYHPETRALGGEVVVRAKHVVLSAGAVGTPRLLHTCGLADRMGPVGEGLHVHPGSAVLGICDHDVLMWKGATQGAYYHPPDLPGVLPHTFSASPDVCLTALAGAGWRGKSGFEMLPKLCGLIVMVSDKGQGRVGAHSDGRAKISYRFDDDDVGRIKNGMVDAAKVLLAGGAKQVFAPVHNTGVADSADALATMLEPAHIRDFMLYAAHPMSTCRMGTDPNTSVVDANGESHAVEGLSIADASVFPTSLGVNPQLTVMALANQIGRGLAQRL